ncbi:MAG: ribonuclease Z [Microthrixaceae bacterium]
MRVVPFGTSSGRPTPRRNVSGLGVDLGARWILVDCGEGTQHQVMRSRLRGSKLSTILITHLHGDHALGLPGMLASLSMDDRTHPVTVVGPTGIGAWLDVMTATPLLELGFPLDLHELDPSTVSRTMDDEPPEVLRLDDGVRVGVLPLKHRVPCLGYRIEEPARPGRLDTDAAAGFGIDEGPILGRLQRGETVEVGGRAVRPGDVIGPPRRGRRIAVMGDTVRCDNAVVLARDADLLVHEATYARADAGRAARWMHSTSTDAAHVAAESAAAHLLLTHFSARYDNPDRLLNEARTVFAATDLAVELAEIPVPHRD